MRGATLPMQPTGSVNFLGGTQLGESLNLSSKVTRRRATHTPIQIYLVAQHCKQTVQAQIAVLPDLAMQVEIPFDIYIPHIQPQSYGAESFA